MNTQKIMALLVASVMVASCNNEEPTTAYNDDIPENISYASVSWNGGNDYDGKYNAIPDRDYAYVAVEEEGTVTEDMNQMESEDATRDKDANNNENVSASMSTKEQTTKNWNNDYNSNKYSSLSDGYTVEDDDDYSMTAAKVQEVPKTRYKTDNETCVTSAKNNAWEPSTEEEKDSDDAYTAVSITSTTYYAPETVQEKEHNRMDVLVGTWKNDDLTIRLYDSGLAKEVIKNEGSTPQKTYVSWDVKGTDKELCLIESATGVENCYDMLVINKEELELYMYDKKVILKKQ